MKFFVYAEDKCIGWSNFEGGDPPMGVVSGRFYPALEYIVVRPLLRKNRKEVQIHVGAEDNFTFHPVAGVYIEDYFDEIPEADLCEISMLGLPQDEYMRYFPEYYQKYEEDMRRRLQE